MLMRIERSRYLDRLVSKKGNGLIKVITGVRRCGKSYLLNVLFHEHLVSCGIDEGHIIEIALDDRRNRRLRDPDEMLAYLDARIAAAGDSEMPCYIVIDEVQLLDEFVDVLNSLLHVPSVDVYVTGSNSKFLASDVVTEFRGRGDQVRLHPLSFAEYCSAVPDDPRVAWNDYLVYGGMPLVLSMRSPEEKAAYLHGLFEEVYLIDIAQRHNLRNAEGLAQLVDVLASSVGSLVSPFKISNTFASEQRVSLSDKTIERYLVCLEDSFLVTPAKRYDVKGRRHIGSPSKLYFEDVGLRNARLNFRQIEESHLMENVVFNELVARGYSVDVGVVDAFGRDESGKTMRSRLEIDFVVNRGSTRYYVQSALRMDTPEKAAQEKRSLQKTGDSFRKLVITKDAIASHYDDDGIQTVDVLDFLLDPDSLERSADV